MMDAPVVDLVDPTHLTIKCHAEDYFQLEPRSKRRLLTPMLICGLLPLVPIWLMDEPLVAKLEFTGLGVTGVIAFVAIIMAADRAQQKHGPYLVVQGDEIRLRDGHAMRIEQFDRFEIVRQWWRHERVSRLIVLSTSGQSYDVVLSDSHGPIVKVMQELDARIETARRIHLKQT